MQAVILLILLILLSGFFSGAEIAFFSLEPAKLQALKRKARTERTKKRIRRLENLKNNPNRLLVTILLGNNAVNIAASAIATVATEELAHRYGLGHSTAMVIGSVTGVMTLIILMFGEIAPKSIAYRYSTRFSLFCAPILKVLQSLLFLIVVPLAKLVDRFSGPEKPDRALSEEELKAAVELAEQEGNIEKDEKRFVEKILEFDEHSAGIVMSARSQIFMLSADTLLRDAAQQILKQGYSRIPIYDSYPDRVLGILTLHALVGTLADHHAEEPTLAEIPLLKPFKIPASMKIDTLLREFQARKTHMALVYDGHGGLLGLITLEDVLEEVFGEFQDETDTSDYPLKRFKRLAKNRFLCAADVELEQIGLYIKRTLGDSAPPHLPWSLQDENKALGDFLLEKFEHFPCVGEEIAVQQDDVIFQFTVCSTTEENQIEKIEFSIY